MSLILKIKSTPYVIKVWSDGDNGFYALLDDDYVCICSKTSTCHAYGLEILLKMVNGAQLKVFYFKEKFISFKPTPNQIDIVQWVINTPTFSETESMSLDDFSFEYDIKDDIEIIHEGLSLTSIHNKYLYISKNKDVLDFFKLELERFIDLTENEGLDQFLIEYKSEKEAKLRVRGIVRSVNNIIKKIESF